MAELNRLRAEERLLENRPQKIKRFAASLPSLLLVFFLFSQSVFGITCYQAYTLLSAQHSIRGAKNVFRAKGAKFDNAYAIEKEGLLYREIHELFNVLNAEGKKELAKRFREEKAGKKPPHLTRWLESFATKWREPGVALKPSELQGKTPEQILKYLLSLENPLEAISIRGAEELFDKEIMSFDWIERDPSAPEWLDLSDDLGSYEVKSKKGVANRDELDAQRNFLENYFDGDHIGHQHLIHGWSQDDAYRARTAGQYVEVLDASSWYLFWRSMTRHPEDAVIMDHPYLGVHNRAALERLAKAYETNNPKQFNNKFRSEGARNFPGDPSLPGQTKKENVVSWETRGSINKNDLKRDVFHDQMEARLVSGDYDGIRDFRKYEFDASTPLEDLVSRHLTPEELKTLKEFEEIFPMMNFNSHGRAYNHYRNKIISPLLPWGNRLNIPAKADLLDRAQSRYAKALVEIAEQYKKDLAKAKNSNEIGDAREAAMEKIKHAAWRFAKKARLDQDFENYLAPIPKHKDLPDIRYEPNPRSNAREGKNGHRVDVNQIDLGIEYSFRFGARPNSRTQVDALLKKSAEALRDSFGGGTVRKQEDGGHGHGLSVRYFVVDPQGREWRVEWDGISRSYDENNEAVRSRGGHAEIPSPRGAPQDTSDIETLYRAMREVGQFAKRSAGGAHMNFDLGPLRKLGPKTGARMAANFINKFESEREMISFLWQHPYRKRVAIPAEVGPEFYKSLDEFNGDFADLGKLIYQHKYFNEYESRKPVYMQLNMASLVKDFVPKSYRKSIDIKKPGEEWFPSFDKDGDKGEMRLMDAMPDEYMATLQVKYTRALMNAAFNGERIVKYEQKYDQNSKRDWLKDEDKFIKDARAHLESLGLDFNEFRPLVLQARRVQSATPSPKDLLDKGEIKPGKDPETGSRVTPIKPKVPSWTDWEF